MEIPKFEQTKEKLLNDGMTEDDIEEKIDTLREHYDGLISKKEVLAHIIAKERGLVRERQQYQGSKGEPKEVTISELEDGMDNILVKCYVVSRRLTETKKGDEMSWVTIVDETGSTSATIFGEGSIDWDDEFGQAIAIKGQTFEAGGRINASTWEVPEILTEDEMGYSLQEAIKMDISEVKELDERRFVCIEGLCTDLYRNTYEGCMNCKSKMENCDCDGNYGTVDYSFEKLTILTPSGEASIKAQADPEFDVDDDVKLELLRIYGEYMDGSSSDDEEDRDKYISISKLEKINKDGSKKKSSGDKSKSKSDVKVSKEVEDSISSGLMGAENIQKILGFVDRYGEVPKQMFHKYVEGNTDITPPENALDQMKEDGLVYINKDGKVEKTEEE